MKGSLQRVVLMAAVVAALVAPGQAVASADPSQATACGRVTFGYDAHRVHRGEAFDMDMTVTNCSDRVERLRVNARSIGHCDFPHPASHTYRLPPGYSVGMSASALAPSCPGRYSAHIRLTLGRHHGALDTGGDGFFVERH